MRNSGTYFLVRAFVGLMLALAVLAGAIWLASGRIVDTRFIWAVSLPLAYLIGCILMREVPFKPLTAPATSRRSARLATPARP